MDHSVGRIIYAEKDQDICFEKLKFPSSPQIKEYGELHGENLFHVVCRLNIKCLIMLVWEIAVKVFENHDLKTFFMTGNFFTKKVFESSLDSTVNHIDECNSEKNDSRFDSIYYKSIKSLRKTKLNEMIDFNEDENFNLSSTYELIQIAKKLNLTVGEKLDWTKYSNTLDYEMFDHFLKSVFFFLKIHFEIKRELFGNEFHVKAYEVLNYGNNIYNTLMTGLTNPVNSKFVYVILNFLKKNLEKSDYEYHLLYYFPKAFESIFLIHSEKKRKLPEANAMVLYKTLKSSFNDLLLEHLITKSLNFIYIYVDGTFNVDFLKNGITLYCKLLDFNHLKCLMLNRARNDRYVLYHILSMSREVAEHALELLKFRFAFEESLSKIVLNIFWPNISTKKNSSRENIKNNF